MEQLEVLTPENGSESRTGVQNSTGSRIRLVERRISKFEMQLQKMVNQKSLRGAIGQEEPLEVAILRQNSCKYVILDIFKWNLDDFTCMCRLINCIYHFMKGYKLYSIILFRLVFYYYIDSFGPQ